MNNPLTFFAYGSVLLCMPAEPPIELSKDPVPMDHPRYGEMDEALFDLCRRDDYQGLYREFVKRFGVTYDDYAEVVDDLKREISRAEERIACLRQLEALVLMDTDHTGRTRRRTVLKWVPLEFSAWGPYDHENS